MWLYLFVIPLAIVMVIGGLLAGGIFTIVFLPIAVIIAVSAIIYTMWASAHEPAKIRAERDQVRPLPHTDHANTAPAPGTADQLADARRAEQ